MDKIIISRINNTMDIVNEEFNLVFKEMFGGGEARIFLLDPNDPLESGIDIKAQPPGKSIQNLKLFSGGEKSLIAISVDTQDELYFESITQAAEKLNTDRTSISKCISGSQRYTIVKGYIIRELDLYGNIIENNIDIDERISEYNKRNPIIDGIRHDIPTWCNIYNIKQATVNARIRRGWNSINAITTPVKGR